MNTKKATKRALLTSVMALVMCIVMLVGTTFAWFTDTASTAVNKIVAGNLDVDIVGATTETHVDSLNFQNKEGSAAILWEPGCRYVTEGFRIANKGNLALKWKAVVNKGTTVANEGNFDLLDVIDFYLVTGTGENQTETRLDEFTGNLKKAETSEVYYIKAVMQTTAGNDYQGLELNGITITVLATQDTVENDSFNDQYDKNATYAPKLEDCTTDSFAIVPSGFSVVTEEIPEKVNVFPAYTKHTITISSADALLYYGTKFDLEAAKKVEGSIFVNGAADKGGDVIELKLGADIDLGGVELNQPLNIYAMSFDGCGYTISNATIKNETTSGVAGLFDVNGTIMTSFKDVTIKNVTVVAGYGGDSKAGVVFGVHRSGRGLLLRQCAELQRQWYYRQWRLQSWRYCGLCLS